VPQEAFLVNSDAEDVIQGSQIRAARGILGISQAELSKMTSVSERTIKRLEAATQMRGAVATLWKIQTALEQAGVEFIGADETKGPGVRLKQNIRTKGKKAGKRSKAR
jgi:transcriptional regulator with XRE-family HTH domain